MRQASAGAPLVQAEALALVQAVSPALAEAPLVLALAQAARQAPAEAPQVLAEALLQVSRLPLPLLKNLQKAPKDASLT